jgi:ABC-2 type transport system ATP-binding protein
LDVLDLTVRPGEIFGFLGRTERASRRRSACCCTWSGPPPGLVMDVPVEDIERAHRHVAYVPGDVALWPQLTGTEALHLLGNLPGGVDLAFRDELIKRLLLEPDTRSGRMRRATGRRSP